MQYTKHPQYTYTKLGIYYFSKAVPSDLRLHYSKPRIVFSLKTKSAIQASRASKSMLAKLEGYWNSLRLQNVDIPAAHLLIDAGTNKLSDLPTIDDALAIYFKLKGSAKDKTFYSAGTRNIGYVVECLGCRALDNYSTADGSKFRDWLVAKGLAGSSIKRVFSSIKAIVNMVIQEHGLDIRNPFSGIYLPSNDDSVRRHPISASNIKRIQSECRVANDDLRWLIALISDSGMRLAEATGLHIDDLVLDAEIPYIQVQPHPWRTLKTSSSKRVIPLVGASLWAAKAIKANTTGKHCFPRYTNDTDCNSNSASAALNKWMQSIIGRGNVIHGFRHSFRDRLRAIEAATDLIDQLGGWSLQTVGQGYGNGYPMSVLSSAMNKIAGSAQT